MLTFMCHLLYLRSRLGHTRLVGLNVVPLYIEEQFAKRVALDNQCSIVNSTLQKDLFVAVENTKVWSLVFMAVALVEGARVRERQRVWGIPPVHFLHLEIFLGFKSQNFYFAREIHPLFLRQVAMKLA